MTHYTDLSLVEQLIITSAALILLTSFALLSQSRVVSTIQIFAWQGFLLAATCTLVAIDTGESHLLISAVLTLVLKVFFIPWLLIRQAKALNILRDYDSTIRPGFTLMVAGAIVIFCYSLVQPISQFATGIIKDAIALSLSVVLLSMLMLITRRKALTQVVAFMALENGLFFAALAATQGMPLVVELGIAFDVLVAAIIFGVFFFHIKESIDSLDIEKLSSLREGTE